MWSNVGNYDVKMLWTKIKTLNSIIGFYKLGFLYHFCSLSRDSKSVSSYKCEKSTQVFLHKCT